MNENRSYADNLHIRTERGRGKGGQGKSQKKFEESEAGLDPWKYPYR